MKSLDIGKTTWTDRFGRAYKTKWKDLKRTQKMFADEVNKVRTRGENGTIGTVTSQQVSKWLHGSIPEEENLKAICEVLDLDLEYFNPTRSEQYRDSSQYMTEVGRAHVEFAKEIGLDLNLVKALHDLINFGDNFPLYAPICFDKPRADFFTNEVTVNAGRLWEHAHSAPMKRDADLDLDLDFLQFVRDGKRITLHKGDLAFLREVQDQVVDYVKYLFYRRAQEMDKEVDNVKERVKETVKIRELSTGGTEVSYGVIKSKEILTEIDRFAPYGYRFIDKEGGQEDGDN